MTRLALLFTAVLCASGAEATSLPTTVNWRQELLPELYSPEPVLWMATSPAYGTAYGVAIRRAGTAYQIVYVSRAVRAGDRTGSRPPIAQTHCSSKIDARSVDRLRAVWKSMLLDVLPEEDQHFGFDGVDFVFAAQVGNEEIGGATWNPSPGTADALFVELANSLATYCATGAPDIDRKVDALLARVAAERKPE